MKKSLILIVSLILAMGLLLSACSEKKESSTGVEGKYVSDVGDIQLNKDGTFSLKGADSTANMNLTGKYTVKDKEIVFNVIQNSGEEVGVTLTGTLENDTITVPDNPPYVKQK